jgi:intein-encoded DNA endonuclease-like protein
LPTGSAEPNSKPAFQAEKRTSYMRRFVDLSPEEQRAVFEKFLGLRKEGLGYKRIIKQVKQEDNICLQLSTLSYWSNKGVELLGGKNWFEEKPSRELAYLIGVMFGDGTLSFSEKKQDYGIRLESIDLDFAEKFSHCISLILKKKKDYAVCKVTRGPIYSTHARSKQLYSFFKSLKGDFSKAKPFIEEYPSEFIQGLADSEGCPAISAGERFGCGVNVAYSSNLELLEYARWLLVERFSIRSGITLCKKKGIVDSVIDGREIRRTKSLYGLKVSNNQGTKKFHLEIGFSLKRKQEKLRDGLKTMESFDVAGRSSFWKEKYYKEGKRWVKIEKGN